MHALPEGWQRMGYHDFLVARRGLMARVVQDAYGRLKETGYSPDYPEVGFSEGSEDDGGYDERGFDLTTADLLVLGVFEAGATLVGKVQEGRVEATLLADGTVEFDGEVYSSLSAAGKAATGRDVNGWAFWSMQTGEGLKRVRRIRREYATGRATAGDLGDGD